MTTIDLNLTSELIATATLQHLREALRETNAYAGGLHKYTRIPLQDYATKVLEIRSAGWQDELGAANVDDVLAALRAKSVETTEAAPLDAQPVEDVPSQAFEIDAAVDPLTGAVGVAPDAEPEPVAVVSVELVLPVEEPAVEPVAEPEPQVAPSVADQITAYLRAAGVKSTSKLSVEQLRELYQQVVGETDSTHVGYLVTRIREARLGRIVRGDGGKKARRVDAQPNARAPGKLTATCDLGLELTLETLVAIAEAAKRQGTTPAGFVALAITSALAQDHLAQSAAQ